MINSVHLQNFPDVSAFPKAPDLIADMDRVRDACNAGLSIRSAVNIRTRQPLAKLTLYGAGAERLRQFTTLMQDELNVKAVDFSNDLSQVAEHKLKLHNQILGKRLPEKMKQIIPAAKKGEWELVKRSSLPGLSGQSIQPSPKGYGGQVDHPDKPGDDVLVICGEALLPEEYDLQLEPKPGIKGAAALSTNDALVVLDLEITPELELEGLARDFVRMVQEARKTADLQVTNRIALQVQTSGKVAEAIAAHKEYIGEQVLATSLEMTEVTTTHRFEQELEGEKVVFGFTVA